MITRMTLRDIAAMAYGVPQARVEGGPEWVRSTRFEIIATLRDGMTFQPSLLQPILAERFMVRVHTETRRLPIYALVPQKPGTVPLTRSTCQRDPVQTPSGPQRGSDAVGTERIRSCQPLRFGPGAALTGEGVTMADLAVLLGNFPEIGREVRDTTGLPGAFDLALHWKGAVALGPEAEVVGTNPAANDGGIFTALQEQLGLRLERRTADVPVIIMDAALPPTEN